jgi:ring-1,2-phenylacetyl-CoA epoxidase subunit PaaC
MQEAINDLWRFTDELFLLTEADKAMVEAGIGIDVSKMKETYYTKVSEVLEEATLLTPERKYFTKGGKEGLHTEHMGYILADLQYMQKTFPNMTW